MSRVDNRVKMVRMGVDEVLFAILGGVLTGAALVVVALAATLAMYRASGVDLIKAYWRGRKRERSKAPLEGESSEGERGVRRSR